MTSLYHNTLDSDILKKAIHATLKNRGTVYEENHPLFSDNFPKNPRFQMLWKGFIKKIGKTGPDFEKAVSLIKEILFPYWEKYNYGYEQISNRKMDNSPEETSVIGFPYTNSAGYVNL